MSQRPPESGWPNGAPPPGRQQPRPGAGPSWPRPSSPHPPGWGPQQNPSAQFPPQQQYPPQAPPGQPTAPQQPPPAQQFPPTAQQFPPQNSGDHRDGTRPFGDPPPQRVDIESFAPPKNRTPLFVTLVAVLTLGIVLVWGIFFRNAEPAPPAPSSPATTPHTPRPSDAAMPFTSQDGRYSGTWQILNTRWSDEGVSLEIRITADKGPVEFSFMAFQNQGTEVIYPSVGSDYPSLDAGTVLSGDSEQGWVFFELQREESTVILANGRGRQMSALPVKA